MLRIMVLSFSAFLIANISGPTLLRAQFQEPTKEELQMTADPKAPGAAAVYLYREDVTDQLKSTRSFYERIKVLTEKGKEMATVTMPYISGAEKVDIQGRTIHPDGTIIPLTDKPADLTDVTTRGIRSSALVFSFPNVEVGSILEFRITVHYSSFASDPVWIIQQNSFVHKAHYALSSLAASKLAYVYRIGAGARVTNNKMGIFTLDIDDIPAVPQEDWMPPINTLKWRVEFFYTKFSSSQEFWDYAEKNWADVVRGFIEPTGSLKKAAAAMIAPEDTETQKAQKIYAVVMKLENTDFTREKSKVERKKEKIKDIHNAQDVWKDQSGTGDELALLFVALCRAAGLDMAPMEVVDRSRALFDPEVLSSWQLDDYIAVGRLDGKEIYFDPGQQMCPFGMLHWKHSLARGFRLADKTAVLADTPPLTYKASSVQRVAALTIDQTGGVSGNLSIVLSGQEALRWRQIALENDEEEVKKQFNEWLRTYLPDGVEAEFDHFLALNDYNSYLMGLVRISGSLGTVTGKRLFLPGLFFEAKSKHPFVTQDKRQFPVDVHYPKAEEDDVTYHLPTGYKVESGPKQGSITWPDHAQVVISMNPEGDSLNVHREMAYNYTILDPKDYAELHDFYQKVATTDQQQTVLIRGAASN